MQQEHTASLSVLEKTERQLAKAREDANKRDVDLYLQQKEFEVENLRQDLANESDELSEQVIALLNELITLKQWTSGRFQALLDSAKDNGAGLDMALD